MSPATRLSLAVVLCVSVILPGLLFAQTSQPLIVESVDESRLTQLPGNTYPLARAEFDQGTAPADLPMQRMLLVLKRSPDQSVALLKLLDDQQDKASQTYHKWLTPEQFGRQFGPSDQDIQTITSWLESHGFQSIQVTKGRTVIEFSGTADQVQETFHTAIHKYSVNGEDHWANSGDPQIPAALVPAVAGVSTLHNFYKKPMIRVGPRVPVVFAPGPPPQVTFPPQSGQPAIHALGPQDYAKIYNINPVYQGSINGSGVTIGVVGRSNINLVDVFDFDNAFGINLPSLTVQLDGPDPGNLGGGEEAEALLDTTWSSAIAPGASVTLLVSASTNTTDGADLSAVYIIDSNFADIMTESFGSCEAVRTDAEITAQGSLAEQAAAQGITYLVSTGDTGAEGCDDLSEQVAGGPVSVNYLASTPFTVAVGGTIFNEGTQNSKYWTGSAPLAETALSYIPENVWNESCLASQCGSENASIAAGGGGASSFFTKPSWQSGVNGIPTDNARDLPDVSLTASLHDPYLLCLEFSCEQGFIYFIGGTSASTPSFAGIMALVLDGVSKGTNPPLSPRQGQANYVLYRLAAQETLAQCNGSNTVALPGANCIFNDVTVGNNAVPGEAGYGASSAKYQAGVGYDLATGLGSVNVANLVNNWSSITFNPTTTTLTVSPLTNITHGATVNVDITVTPNSGGGPPTGNAALFALYPSSALPLGVGAFTLDNTGSVSATTRVLPGGNYTLSARYAGDKTFGASTSAQTPAITISAEPSVITTTVLAYDQNGNALPPSNVPYGSVVLLRADVAGKSGFGTPTGSVLFQDDTGLLGTNMQLNSEGNLVSPQPIFTLSGGTHPVTASYAGDASFKPGVSAPADITVTPVATATSVSASSNNAGQGSNVTLTAIVSATSLGDSPSGTVSFFSGATVLGNAQGSFSSRTGGTVQAIASFATTQLPDGQDSITAQYNGDANYATSNAPAITVNVQPDFTVLAGAPSVTITAPGGSGTLALTITGQPGYNGTISFNAGSCSGLPRESTCSFNPPSLTGSGQTTVTIATTAPRTSTLRGFEGWTAGTGFVFAGVALLGISPKRRRLGTLLSLALCAFLLTTVSCGGSSNNSNNNGGGGGDPGTPIGQQTVTVTATSGTLTHTTSFTVNVQ